MQGGRARFGSHRVQVNDGTVVLAEADEMGEGPHDRLQLRKRLAVGTGDGDTTPHRLPGP